MKILYLTLKKKWFDLIAIGTKIEEYREIKPYWKKRLMKDGNYIHFDEIHFRNGYRKDSPFMRVEYKFTQSAYRNFEPVNGVCAVKVFVIHLGKIIEKSKEK